MNDIRKGRVIVLDDEPFVVVGSDFMRKQKSRPVMRTQLKHLVSGASREHTFQQADKVAEADVTRQAYQFLYSTDAGYSFMDNETFEQVELDKATVGEAGDFLLDGQSVELVMFDDQPVAVQLPIKIDRKVEVAPPGVKGNTSTNVMKEVVLEGGAKIKAPLFIKEGDKIRIDTRTGEYVERA